jgi:hypothetical protein
MIVRLIAAAAAMMLLAGCDARVGKSEDAKASGNPDAPAEGKAEEGKLSLKAPGFDVAIRIPEGLSDRANMDEDNKLLFPGSKLSGLHIAAAMGDGTKDKSGVELRFTSSEPVEKVLAWYRDPARKDDFRLSSDGREGAATLLEGKSGGDKDPFKLRLSAREGGGTDGRLTLTER